MEEMGQGAWGSYPKIYTIGHRALREVFNDPVLVEEKVDGSQISFGVFDTPEGQELKIKSKGAMVYLDAPEAMFSRAVEEIRKLQPRLKTNWKYVGEYLRSPSHNTLIYHRIPKKNIIIFDICNGHEDYLSYGDKYREAQRLGLETVPNLYVGMIEDVSKFRTLLNTFSVLGGTKIEGFVIKNYKQFGPDGKALMGKFVSEEFKEAHNGAWTESNPGQGDAITKLGKRYQTQARWRKAVQHLEETGGLLFEPNDIGHLIKEAKRDIMEECKEEIKDALWKAFGEKIVRMATAGLPEWYKGDFLVKRQFGEGYETNNADNTKKV